jgi:hypothetical protein
MGPATIANKCRDYRSEVVGIHNVARKTEPWWHGSYCCNHRACAHCSHQRHNAWNSAQSPIQPELSNERELFYGISGYHSFDDKNCDRNREVKPRTTFALTTTREIHSDPA